MTERDFYTKAIEVAGENEALAEFKAYAEAGLVKLNEKNAKAAEKRAAKKAEDAPLIAALEAILTDEPLTAAQIAEKVEGINTTSKATVIAKALVDEEKAKVTEVKNKSRIVKGYVKA